MKNARPIHLVVAAVGAAVLLTAIPAWAETIEIHFSGVNLSYDGTDLTDAVDPAGRKGDPNESDPLVSMSFLKDGVPIGTTLTEDIYVDFLIADLKDIRAGGEPVYSGGNGGDFGFDLLTSQAGWGLALDINQFQMYLSQTEIAMAADGIATGIHEQNLPFDLVMADDQQISIVISGTMTGLTRSPDGQTVASFTASGTGQVNGGLGIIPEPSSVCLALMAVLAAAAVWWRRR